MITYLLSKYYQAVLKHPKITLLFVLLIVAFFGIYTKSFRLDASADALILENDTALQYYRSIRARYGSDDFLVVTYSPKEALFSDGVLADLHILRDELAAIDDVQSVTTILDVPLVQSPPVGLADLATTVPNLESPATDRALAKKELLTSPLYRNLIISPDGKTTALQVIFHQDETGRSMQKKRDQLRAKRLKETLTPQEQDELRLVTKQYDMHTSMLQDQQKEDIAKVREIMDKHRGGATMYLGGVPMISSDSMGFISHDLTTFGLGVLAFMICILVITFRKIRWVILPILTCVATGIITIGFLGLVDWPVTVVSSNFISLLLIITLSLTIHLIVRYRELQALSTGSNQQELVQETLRSKFSPCFYTVATTIVAFGSLLFSGIRPIIDFGWMMSIGISVAFIIVFSLFPATLMFLQPGAVSNENSWTDKVTGFFAGVIQKRGVSVLFLSGFFTLLSVVGISKLSVENRFIDYFKEKTEIYRGMEQIDRELGGTTPLDVIIDAPADFFGPNKEDLPTAEKGVQEELLDDDFGQDDTISQDELLSDDFNKDGAGLQDDLLDDDFGQNEGYQEDLGITGSSYWFNTYTMKEVFAIQDYLDSLPQTGKVLSIATAMKILSGMDQEVVLDDFALAVFYKKLPMAVKDALFTPYMSEDGNQLRFSIRVFESDTSLKREALLQEIRQTLTSKMHLQDEQIHLSGMLVLYNNMLQSLFRSQILTIGAVFLAIMAMFIVLFRNLKMAFVAIIPNILAAAMMLGLMGLATIPLDMMTITIAAISIGIAVDNTIHYVDRFSIEFYKDRDYWGAIRRSHATIGRAMYYTTLTITLGFSILSLSNFVPTIYFGLLTGFAMLIALLANLTLLPLLIVWLKPRAKQA